MNKVDQYKIQLQGLQDRDDFLLQESALPGPRANLELLQAVADLGSEQLFLRYLAMTAELAPYGSAGEFLPVCGTAGLGRLVVEGKTEYWAVLRGQASDRRWRVREAVAIALQRCGRQDMPVLLEEMRRWCAGSLLEKRAVVAALCEPALLVDPINARAVLAVLDEITAGLLSMADRRGDEFRVLRQALGYGWSVAAAALPEDGKATLEKWFACPDKDIRWIMKENLKKKRLARMDAEWTVQWLARMEAAGL